ncbi:molybdate ABC transporter substrate-binding protein [Fusobacterium sp.]|uniref:molybdate ABC transporter substrate-binding protein n=1 Tax=Fusobacterium sp. TaxID=68766 RepID=UPI0025BCC0A8|nr:molybdate ABC transporter substrate-binding protein [Fusobacterium sp.]
MKKNLVGTLLMLMLFSISSFASEITISCAASLKEVIEELSDKFNKENKKIKVNINLGGSGALKNQIIAGAPVDLVFFASQKDLTDLSEKGFIEKNYQKNMLKNRLVIAGRTQIQSLDKLLGYKTAIGIPETVPAGRYAKEVLTNSKLWSEIHKDLVFTKDVRSAAQYVDLYEVDFSFIYKTDVTMLKNSDIVFTVPEELHSPIIYSYGIVKDRANTDVVKFYNFLNSEYAKKIYEKYNFELVE